MSRSIDGPKGVDFRTRASPVWLEPRANGYTLELHVQPGARRTAVIGLHGARLKIAVASPPVEGRANAALAAFVAECLRIPKSRVAVLAGAGSRDKRVAVDTALTADAVVQALLPPAGQ